MRHAILAAILLTLAGCASSPISPDDAAAVPPERIHSHGEQTSERTAPVQITRDTGLAGQPCHAYVSVDREKAASIDAGETARIWVEPGTHIVAAQNHDLMCGFGPVETQITATAGETTRLRIFWGRGSGIDITPTAY